MAIGYPLIEKFDGFSTRYEEMTPEQYNETLERFRASIEGYRNSTSRRQREYGSYLNRWFGDSFCDGIGSVDERVRLHKLPMSCNVYLFG